LSKKYAITVEGLSKKFRSEKGKDFWALKDLSFNVEPGITTGIIGRNGAGKSTLLNILGSITKPTSGKIVMNGRIASIMEVGTGFHPDLSGRDNVFLNGQLLGMSRNEVRQRFDEIVEFSEIEDFIDVPVKNYSSGMYLRLAFSIFTHLNADIILLDEVMSVGDAKFRLKCQKRIAELSDSGATVLMISHDPTLITETCSRCIYIEKGQIVGQGATDRVVNQYYEKAEVIGASVPNMVLNLKKPIETSTGQFKFFGIVISNSVNAVVEEAEQSDPNIYVNIYLETCLDDSTDKIVLRINHITGSLILADSISLRANSPKAITQKGMHRLTAVIPSSLLNPGIYYVSLVIGESDQRKEAFERLVKFSIENSEWEFNNQFVGPPLDWSLGKWSGNDLV